MTPRTRFLLGASAWLFVALFSVCQTAPALPPSPTNTTIAHSEQFAAYVFEVFKERDGNHWFNGCRYDGKSLTYLSELEGWLWERR